MAMPPAAPGGPEDLLLDLAGRIEADGGMPGSNQAERSLATLVALLCFAAEGHTATAGAFRSHVGRLLTFLESRADDALVREALARIRQGAALPGGWADLAKPLRQGKSLDARRARRALKDALA